MFLHLNVLFLNKFVVPSHQSIKKVCTTDGAKRKPFICLRYYLKFRLFTSAFKQSMALTRPSYLQANELSKIKIIE